MKSPFSRCPITGDYQFVAGPFRVIFGSEVPELELSWFFVIGLGDWCIELGDLDQGVPGLYVTKFKDGDVAKSWPLLQFGSSKEESP